MYKWMIWFSFFFFFIFIFKTSDFQRSLKLSTNKNSNYVGHQIGKKLLQVSFINHLNSLTFTVQFRPFFTLFITSTLMGVQHRIGKTLLQWSPPLLCRPVAPSWIITSSFQSINKHPSLLFAWADSTTVPSNSLCHSVILCFLIYQQFVAPINGVAAGRERSVAPAFHVGASSSSVFTHRSLAVLLLCFGVALSFLTVIVLLLTPLIIDTSIY